MVGFFRCYVMFFEGYVDEKSILGNELFIRVYRKDKDERIGGYF